MSDSSTSNQELLAGLAKLFEQYFDKNEASREKTPMDKFWGTYLRGMKDEDEARPKDWDGNTGSILTFTGLFAATVAAFLIESYKSLSPDSGDQTVALLQQILVATTNSSSGSSGNTISADTFSAPVTMRLVNALWFCSLVISLACALLSTLVQQWSRDYVRDLKEKDTLDEDLANRVLNHVYIRMGVDSYGMDKVVNVTVALVHLAVIIFAVGLLLFLLPIDDAVFICIACTFGVFGVAYLIAGWIPILDPSCPYRTPLTYPLSLAYVLYMKLLDCSPSDENWLRKRRIPRKFRLRDGRSFLTFERFRFIWQHTSRQLISSDEGSMMLLLTSIVPLIAATELGEGGAKVVNYFLTTLYYRRSSDGTSTSELNYDDRIDLTVSLEPNKIPEKPLELLKLTCVFAWWSHYSPKYPRYQYVPQPFGLIDIIICLIMNQGFFSNDPVHILEAQFCLCHLRWALCQAEKNTSDTTLRDTTYRERHVFNDQYFLARKQYSKNSSLVQPGVMRDFKHPRALLLLLNSWQYNTIDTIASRESYGGWETYFTSCLVPLHDGACCRHRNGPSNHVAACTILTMVAHFLRSSVPDKMAIMRYYTFTYGSLCSPYHSPFSGFHVEFELPGEGIASTEFLGIFIEWMEYKNMFKRSPNNSGQDFDLLDGIDSVLHELRACVDPGSLESANMDDGHAPAASAATYQRNTESSDLENVSLESPPSQQSELEIAFKGDSGAATIIGGQDKHVREATHPKATPGTAIDYAADVELEQLEMGNGAQRSETGAVETESAAPDHTKDEPFARVSSEVTNELGRSGGGEASSAEVNEVENGPSAWAPWRGGSEAIKRDGELECEIYQGSREDIIGVEAYRDKGKGRAE